ncbi:hypothetical protein A3D05_02290 [Candidatus Gottesmanbacteria bacterium RIFCSPHIGHO2_02_FULL_40_24]|uniref:Chromosomal replication initiator protein DnaA n=1 Tax=Candidatus Gottesmanbacteria bacterium RIFCSPHIGHO2_01_FULL_40_15 TaxID=1798376 RepID=A0A1F5Z3G2_9BACT|nr:MAG: hypothetical protein A2777_03965 [Candidatus Gottesmanbacteria bacterium RIFCSPHIGHO2_01_FULL_40_15]OGG18681.1 MAG: hypothetical protein A3D05_02290 [Candidatus Gottesmanbacteria bacterium RIFCSPHIGHO2_02_FULL_40_24]OGG22973.1 MAG: hypothetical protein A3E42_06495 [Candidatus Gottesmanbacteria bacterium RIFCSPHIGHO2_12_FULL_40_13]OGG31892.1 MAG: hypothetical protein A3I80_02630 [Candidatus Gottesmanbacteria bacterium RIFCSPLOWO2_02_FULL_40_10]
MDEHHLWATILADLELQVSEVVFRTLISQTSLESLDDGKAVISCNNPMLINIIEKRYHDLIKTTLRNYTKKDVSLVFNARKNKHLNHIDGPLFTMKLPDNFSPPSTGLKLNRDYNFENFAVSSSNQMAYAAATAVVNNLGHAYNPLVLYGGVGVGKTHLMQAVGHAVGQKNIKTKILYCTGEEFTNEIIEAISTKTTVTFKKKYRLVDLLLIDDVQFIAGKYSIQEEFFHTFNAVYQAKKQIIITSDKPPEEINKLEDRLRSRFECGLTIDIGNPDFELRTAIVLIKAKQKGYELSMESAKTIAANIENTRKLEGTLTRVISESQTKNLPVNNDLIKNILGKTLKKIPPSKKVLPEEILKAVAGFYNLKISQLKGDKRDKVYSFPRQILYYLLRTEAGVNLKDIGEFLGGRDHTTILHGIRKISNLLSTDNNLRGDVMGIKNELFV